jgi:hypothetical protein
MMLYILYKYKDTVIGAYYTISNIQTSFNFDPDNTDYQTFKTSINDKTAQLETADGVLMTPDEAIAYVATLP